MTNDDGRAARRGRGRGSMMAAIRQEGRGRDGRGPMRAADGAIDYFRLRVAAQQFMNENGPLFAAFARSEAAPEVLLGRGSLAQAVEAATGLATAVARRFTGKAQPAPHEIRPFRRAAAEIAAQAWRETGIDAIDVERVAAEHAAAFQIVDEDLDRGAFEEMDLSDGASLAMTAASVTLALMRPVMVYDFRRDRAELLSGMSSAVMAMAAEAAAQLVPGNARPAERRSVLQTAANRLADVMAAVYERKARQVVGHIGALPEDEKEAFARRYDPLPEVNRAFREWGVAFAATSLAFARGAAAASGMPAGPGSAAPRA